MDRLGACTYLLAVAAALGLALAAGCGGRGSSDATEAEGAGEVQAGDVTPLPSSSCGPLEYGGDGEPQVLIASDLPLQGPSRTQSPINQGIRLILEQAGWKAGDLNVAFQACDDSTTQAGRWDSGKCDQNARAYADNPSVVAVIGPLDSGCAAVVIPVLNQASGGGLAMVSPGNTQVCLTEAGPGCSEGEPERYYPTGLRNYTRTVANDAFQGAAVAELAQQLGVTRLYILNDREAYGLGIAENVRGAAEALGIEVVGFEPWDPRATSYEALFTKVEQSGANGIFLAGGIDANGGQLIRDKVDTLGPNPETASDGVVLIAPDGFTTQATIDPEAGGATEAEGMYLTVAGAPLDELGAAGQEFVDAFRAEYADELDDTPIDPSAAYGAQAAQVALDAIAKGGGDRPTVIEAMFDYRVEDGILGTFSFNENGDPTGATGAVVSISAYRAIPGTALGDVAAVISPVPATVDAARGLG